MDARVKPAHDGVVLALPAAQRPAYRGEALLLRGPVAAAGDGAVDHQIMAVDEGGFVAGEKYRGVRNILRQSGARDRLRGPENLAHGLRRLLRGLDRQAQRLAENTGGDHARRDAVDANARLAELHRHASGK